MSNAKQATSNTARQGDPAELQARIEFEEWCMSVLMDQLSSFDGYSVPLSTSAYQDALAHACLQHLDAQTLTQRQMKEVCAAIRAKAKLGEVGYTAINFQDFTQHYVGDTFYFADASLGLKVLEGDGTLFVAIHESCRTDTRVSIGEHEGVKRAFLEADFGEGDRRIVELAQVGMLSTFTVKDQNLGVLTMFNSELDIVIVDVLDCPLRQKYPLRTDIPAGTKAPHNRGDFIVFRDEEY